jgi:hypothetical protein
MASTAQGTLTSPVQVPTQQVVTQELVPVTAVTVVGQVPQPVGIPPTPERIQEDKKKEASNFLKFYFHVNPTLRISNLRRTTILALYTNKVPAESRYKKPNDMANLCGVTYGHIFGSLDETTAKEFIKLVEMEKQSIKKEGKKRRRKKQAGDASTTQPTAAPPPAQEMNIHDQFVSCLKFSSHVPFLELIPPDQLDANHEWALTHPDYSYTLEDLTRWETELKEIKMHSKLLDETVTSPFSHLSRLDRRIDIPVNIFETPDSFILYAFVPYHKPNAMKVTVNQMDVVLEGTISLPNSAVLPNGDEVFFPEGLMCTKAEIPEGNFCKLVKLTAPVASSVVGKRDGVIVIHARKEESQPTIHQL